MLQSRGGPDLVMRRGGAATPLQPTQNGGYVSRQGGHDPPTCDTKPWIRTYKICIMRTSGFVSQARGGARSLPPATQNHSFVSQAALWTKKLDFDTYAMPGALVWGDLHHLMRLSVWEGSGPKMEGSGPKSSISTSTPCQKLSFAEICII